MTASLGTLAASLAVALALSCSASAQSRLPDLDLEDLMTLDAGQVFGASERLQPALEAFALPGDYNSRILLLVNGHRVNDNVFGQAEVGAEFGLDPAMFERVEIIRGPASSLSGDSAFFAVVNVITRSGASLGGGSISLETGTLGTRLLRAAAGHRFGSGLDVALSSTYEQSDGVGRLYFPAFDTPATNSGVAEGLDGEGVKTALRTVELLRSDRDRRVRQPAARRADRLVRDRVQRAGLA